jgi:hypothetical protein
MTQPHHSTAQEIDAVLDDEDAWVTPDDIWREVQMADDPAYHASLARQFGPIFQQVRVINAARAKDFGTLTQLTANDPELKQLAFWELTKHARVISAAQRQDFSTLTQLTANDFELTMLACRELAREHTRERERAPGDALDEQHVAKAGRNKQRFTKSEIKRAQDAAPDRTLSISLDGGAVIELSPPIAKDDGAPPNPWEQDDDAT